jgi:aminoglycoside phosphotransferase (APT) family kinase protein
VAEVRCEPSVEQMLRGASNREPWKNSDSLSGSRLERAVIDGQRVVVKYVCVDDDWIMRATGDLHCRQLTLLTSGTLDRLPAVIDHAIIACAPYTSAQGHRGAALLMRDVSGAMVPAGSDPISMESHRDFLEHMAQLHAVYLGSGAGVDLCPLAHHYVFLSPMMAELETASARTDPVPRAVASGWRALQAQHPRQARVLLDLARDPAPLLAALRAGPSTLLHGDWKLGNLGSIPGATILLDWDRCGSGPPLVDFAWYLAVNCDRLPESKEDAIAAYRCALESAGVETSAWWNSQLRAALAGGFLQLGWNKNHDDAEFGWWADRLDEALPLL